MAGICPSLIVPRSRTPSLLALAPALLCVVEVSSKAYLRCPRGLQQCSNGQCIKETDLCDGSVDCRDGSDESIQVCSPVHDTCPPWMFRCTSGKCINRNKTCNNIADCEDNSDEMLPHCRHERSSGDTCKITEFSCISGQCISLTSLCDGLSDCFDGSDELELICFGFSCGPASFQCSYGACIDEVKKCDKTPDCNDHSDEWNDTCGSVKTTRRPTVIDETLERENVSYHGHKENCYLKELFNPHTSRWTHCHNYGKDFECTLRPAPHTQVHLACKVGYKTDPIIGSNISMCRPNGTWSTPQFSCEPDCGVKSKITPLINYAPTVREDVYPWHIGLYSYDGTNYKYLCGGSILNEKVVLTAAHCVFDEETKTVRNSSFWITAGKYWSDWQRIETHEQKIEVLNVSISERYFGSSSNYEQDIALLALKGRIKLNAHVMPICLRPTYNLKPRDELTVPGWGATENGTVSEELRVTKLIYRDFHQCEEELDYTLKSFLIYDRYCAGLDNGTRLDRGDSGGGLVFAEKSSNVTEVYYLYGIVSIELSHNIIGFTNPALYYDWIFDYMRTEESKLYSNQTWKH